MIHSDEVIIQNTPLPIDTTGQSINVGNFPATQPVSGSVSVSNFPATQPVSGTVTATQGTSPWIISGTVSTSGSGVATSTISQVVVNNTSTALLAARAGRIKVILYVPNSTTLIALDSTVSATHFTYTVNALNSTIEITGYTGAISAMKTSGSTTITVTDL